MMRIIRQITIIALVSLFLAVPALAQENELRLGLSKTMGYAMGGEIQGLFTMKASGPDDLSRVVFYLDDQVLGEVIAPPFDLRFTTDNFDLGFHTLWAQGFTATGSELRSNEIRAEFVSSSEGWKSTLTIIVPIFGVLIVAVLLSAFFPVGGRKLKNLAPGAERRYGISGGVICPRCHRPFPVPFMSLNLGVSRLVRCPFCGKWSVRRSNSLQELRAAEAAELKDAQAGAEVIEASPEEKLRKELDESRFM